MGNSEIVTFVRKSCLIINNSFVQTELELLATGIVLCRTIPHCWRTAYHRLARLSVSLWARDDTEVVFKSFVRSMVLLVFAFRELMKKGGCLDVSEIGLTHRA